jgi:hypothetical protein
MPKTPVTETGLRRYDHLPSVEAVYRAWNEPGPRPDWHKRTKADIYDSMPLLARALDRLDADEDAVDAVNAYGSDDGRIVMAVRVGGNWRELLLSVDDADQLQGMLYLLLSGHVGRFPVGE